MSDQFPILWPSVSVVVCVYNGESTIERCLAELAKIDYPDFEVLVVNDGSSDSTSRLVAAGVGSKPHFRAISLDKNQGLSFARNVGLNAARGEIVAYLDADAWPGHRWLHSLAEAFLDSKFIAIGGPNLLPPGSNVVAQCVDLSPGTPQCVSREGNQMDHIAGCNLAVRRPFALAIGGFDPLFRVAGDDVDFCWKIQKFGGSLGFSGEAVVWHERRAEIRQYLRQQRGYGRAEALLFRRWPEKYNCLGHVTWGAPSGVYGGGGIYGGSMYGESTGFWRHLLLLPEWNLVLGLMLALSLVSLAYPPLAWSRFALAIGLLLSTGQAALHSSSQRFSGSFSHRARCHLLVALLFSAQSLYRLAGRLEYGLHPLSACASAATLKRTRA